MDIYRKILVIGAQGQLGQEIMKVFAQYAPHGIAIEDLDLSCPPKVVEYLETFQPTLVINCAAYNDVDGAEINTSEPFLINAITPGYISKWCKEYAVPFVQYSTDYVFDGTHKNGYTEDVAPSPISVYAQSKALMEQLCAGSYIIRTSYIFGRGSSFNFVRAIINSAQSGKDLTVVDDQVHCYTHAHDLALQTKYILDHSLPVGIYHITNEGGMSLYGLAQIIVSLLGLANTITPVSTDEYYKGKTTPVAKRPLFSALINTKLPSMRSIKEALEEYIVSTKI
ncbi:MAG: NAD(P)-dependent oxidoreductase [bacterium]|nr:NAD(P)-dependent oxidoreductase [bacterium]